MTRADVERGRFLKFEAESTQDAAQRSRGYVLASEALEKAYRGNTLACDLLREAAICRSKQAELDMKYDDAERVLVEALSSYQSFEDFYTPERLWSEFAEPLAQQLV